MRTLRLRVRDADRVSELEFHRFPVRIGRDDTNDCVLRFPFVSRTHAILDVRDESLVLRDTGSTHGTFVGDERLAGDCRELGATESAFRIGTLNIEATLLIEEPDVANDATEDMLLAGLIVPGQTQPYATANVDPAKVDAAAAAAHVRPLIDAYRNARSALLAAAEGPRAEAIRELVAQEVSETPARASEPPSRGSAAADVALRGLRELSASYVPYAPPLTDVESVAAFLLKLEATLNLFFDAFASLRFAHHAPPSEDAHVQRVDVAARMLDWTDRGNEAAQTVERECFDMVACRLKMGETLEREVTTLLDTIAPARLERSVSGPFRHRRLWSAYGTQHEVARNAARELVARIFHTPPRAVRTVAG